MKFHEAIWELLPAAVGVTFRLILRPPSNIGGYFTSAIFGFGAAWVGTPDIVRITGFSVILVSACLAMCAQVLAEHVLQKAEKGDFNFWKKGEGK